MRSLRLLALIGLQAWLVSSWKPKFHLGRPMYGLKVHHERTMLEVDDARLQKPQSAFGASEGYFTQKLDHFDDDSTVTWSQRYFSNFQYQIAGSNVVFLMLGGEGPESIDWVQNENYPFVGWAKERGAALFDLEHRFYGQSRPTADQSVANLRFLSSRQAIEDIATFIRAMNVKYNLGNASWITFGGSYSGALSLWAREKYPDLIAGAVGSSAPVQAEVDFWKYLQVVEESLRSHSEDCAESVRIAFAQMVDMMNTEIGRSQLSQLFYLKSPLANLSLTYNDIQNFYSTIYSIFQEAVQYSGVNAGYYAYGFGIKDICNTMNNDAVDELTALQNVMFLMSGLHGEFEGTDNSYDNMISYLRQEQFGSDKNFDSGARSWTWQTCNEFGYFQTSDGGPSGIFGSVTPLTLFINMCRDTFGDEYDADYVDRAVRSTLDYYGGADGYKGTNVVIPNGSLDPWHALGKYTSSDPSVVWYLIEGTAHCADMYPPRESDAPGLTVVRKLIGRNIELWLSKNPSPFAPESKSVKTWAKPGVSQSLFDVKEANRSTFQRSSQSPLEALPNWKKFRKVHLGRPPHGFRPAPEMDVSNTPLEYETGFFTQPVDHFDPQNPNTFKQRYFKNAQWAMPGGPSFMMIGGEGPESPKWVLNENITYLTWARKYGATVYLLEHRYYGESIVLENRDLSYLSSLQMLYDVANFIRNVNLQAGGPTTWITFGGSYSGALSLWMRELFPGIVQGAVGSSAPVEAKLDFYEYLEVVEVSIRGYSQKCADNIAKGFDSMHQLVLTEDGRATLSDIFTLVPFWDNATDVSDTDVQYFFSNIYSQFQGAVQYSGDNTKGYANGYGIPDLCAFMTNETNDPIENIAQFNQYMTAFYADGYPFTHTANSYEDFVKFLQTAQKYGPDAAASRLWMWQTCTEFGYFQSSDSGYSIFGSPTPLNFYTQLCSDVFGKQYTAAAVQQSVLCTNHRYGGKANYKGTNVVIPNGSVDPWHVLGKYTSDDPSVVWYLINGTAHCADMYPARPEDQPDLYNAREIIEANLAKWLATKGATTTARGTTPVATTSNVKSPSPTPAPAHESSTPAGSAFHQGSTTIVVILFTCLVNLISLL